MEIVRLKPKTRLWSDVMAYARSCPWVAGAHLADMMETENFAGWETVFAAVESGRTVGFCTLLKTDYYPENRYWPWISTVFVDEGRRGRGVCGQLVEAACEAAREAGFRRVYIPSDIVGLYERYGFEMVDKLTNYDGELDNIFAKDI